MPFRVAANAALDARADPRRGAGPASTTSPSASPSPPRSAARAPDWRAGADRRSCLPQGRVRLAGRYGNGLVVQARLDSFDLSMLNAFSPGLGIGGQATGSLDFCAAGGRQLPARRGAAQHRRLHPHRHRHPLARRSTSPCRHAAARGRQAGRGHPPRRRDHRPRPGAAAAARAGGGQLEEPPARGAACPAGSAITARPTCSWSFADLAGQQLTGPIGIAADFRGRVDRAAASPASSAPTTSPIVNETYGTRITNLAVNGRFTSSTAADRQLAGRAGSGTIEGRGTIGLASAAGYPIDIHSSFQNAQLARSDDLGATATGDLAHRQQTATARSISGDLELGEVRYQIVRQGAAEVAELAGRPPQGRAAARSEPAECRQRRAVPSIWKLDLRIRRRQPDLFISGMGLESEWQRRPARPGHHGDAATRSAGPS